MPATKSPPRLPRRPAADADERFVRSLLALSLSRILAHAPRLDRPTLALHLWLTKGELRDLPKLVRRHLPAEPRRRFDEELAEAEDEDDRARAIARAVARRRPLTKAVVAHVRATLDRLARRRPAPRRAGLARSIARLRETFHLSPAEADLCAFVYVVSTWPAAESYFENHLQATTRPGYRYFALALGLSHDALVRALLGKLRSIGILGDLAAYLRIADDFLPFFSGARESDLYRGAFRQVRRAAIPLDAHFVAPTSTEHLLRLLSADASPRPVHVLLYGAAGTGKTSYARGLARATGAPSFEVLPAEDNRTVSQRAALLACLNLTNQNADAIIIVDEADALLNTEVGWLFRGDAQDKGWLNHLLEQPGVRMIWIVNQVQGIADSVRRRFAFSQPFKPFAKQQRVRVWQTVLRQQRVRRLLREADVAALAAQYPVSGGAIESAVRAAKQARAAEEPPAAFQQALRTSLDAHRTLLADGRPVRPADALEPGFALEALNTTEDVSALLRRLARADRQLRESPAQRSAMNLLFFGPPGTGKSELARHLAERLDREPLVRRASDILSMWVGEAEKALAAAFADAEREDALLILDEVDSLLYARSGALRSWEVSLVNELLVQMERFRGLMIATTNRLEGLDPACLRRFQVKLGFDYLTPAGKRVLYRKLLAPLVVDPDAARFAADGAGAAAADHALAALDAMVLAPGDFRVVRDRFALEPPATAAALVAALADEARHREPRAGRRAVGFAP